MYFWGFCCLGHLLLAIVFGCLGDDVECLCVLPRTRVQISLSPPYLRCLYVHVQLCYGLGLACVAMVLGLSRGWIIAVLGISESLGSESPLCCCFLPNYR